MACDNGKKTLNFRLGVWTGGGSTTVFIPAFRVKSGDVEGVRLSLDAEAPAGSLGIDITRAYQGSNDGGVTWGSVTNIGTVILTASGWNWSAAFDTPDVTYQVIEYGFKCINHSTAVTTKNTAHLTVVADIRYN